MRILSEENRDFSIGVLCGSISKVPSNVWFAYEKLFQKHYNAQVLLPESAYLIPKGRDRVRIQEGMKRKLMNIHFGKIIAADFIYVINRPNGYIGPNTFLEIGWAYGHGKRIYLEQPVYVDSPFREELMAILENGDRHEIVSRFSNQIPGLNQK